MNKKKPSVVLHGLFAILVTGLLAEWSQAATATSSPSSCTNATGVGTVAWSASTTGNAVSSDNAYATVSLGNNQVSNYLQCTDYGFAAIPAWAVINGITVNVERKSSSASATAPTDAYVRLIKGGNVVTATNRRTATAYTTADVTESHGSATDLWGTTWTPADLKTTNFGVAFSTQKAGFSWTNWTVSVDVIQVSVDYTIPVRSCVSVVNGNWSSAATWNCGSGPGDGPPTSIDTVTINGQTVSLDTSATVASVTINSGTLKQTGTSALTLTTTGGVTNSGTIADNGSAGSFELDVGGDLIANGVSLTVDTLAVSGSTTSSKPFTVNGDFAVGGDLTSGSATMSIGDLVFAKSGIQALTLNGPATTVSNFTVNAGSTVSSAAYSTINLLGTLTNDGTVSLANTTWVMRGTTQQTITGSSDTPLGNLTMNGTGGLLLDRNVTVLGTLTLTNGVITTGTYSLTTSADCPGAVSGGSGASYVNGFLQLTAPAWGATCVFPVGDATNYAPITFAYPWHAAPLGGAITGSTTTGDHPDTVSGMSGIAVGKSVNRYWTLTPASSARFYTYDATFQYCGSSGATGCGVNDVDALATPTSFIVARKGSTTWASITPSAPTSTSRTITNQTVFGQYAIGEPYAAATNPPLLTKTAGSAAAAVGSYVTFVVTAKNPYAFDLSNVVVADAIPAGMTYTTHVATLGAASLSGQALSWVIPTLPAGGSVQLTLVLLAGQRGSFTNTVYSPGASSASATILILSSSYVHYRMDETVGSWSGAANEVIDSGAKGLHGQRVTTSSPTTTNTISPSPTIASQYSSVSGSFCNAGSFDANAVVKSPYSSFFQFTKQLSASAWIYPTAYPASDLYSILSNDTNYEFHLNPSGKLYWWWSASALTSAATIPRNQWTHVAITFDSTVGRQYIYINGVRDANTNNWTGTLTANACPFYVGGDISTGGGCSLISGRNFRGRIDEVKIYDYELSAAEVQADMNLGRLCSGAFDHVRIEHDGTASACSPKTVTVKACLDSACTALYPGTVTAHLSPSGWAGGDTITFSGGVTTATLNNSAFTSSSVTLGSTSVSPAPASTPNTRCFNGATETCVLTIPTTSCGFDAVEPAASPLTHLYTKLAGAAFNVDILALNSSMGINQSYTGTVTVDLVDTCPSGTQLSSAQPSVTFVSTDKGRKTVALTSNGITKTAQVRIKSGSSYACSSDKLAVRPSAVTLTATGATATPPSAASTPVVKAGATFTLAASTSPTTYSGTLALDTSKLTAQLPSDDSTQQAGGTVGALAPSSLTANAAAVNASYNEVGYLYAAPAAFADTTFTNVDQVGQVSGCAATDTCDCLLSTSQTNPGVPNNVSDVPINGRYGCYVGNKVSKSFGRFVPDHFASVGAVTNACAAGTTTYMGQPFAITRNGNPAVSEIVEARNVADTLTSNYTGKFARGAVLYGAENADNGTDLSARLARYDAASAEAAWAALTGNWNAGVFSLSAGTQAAFKRPVVAIPNATWGPYDALAIGVSVNDADVNAGAAIANADMNPAVAAGATFNYKQLTGSPLRMRYGRARLQNANGSELLRLPINLALQYWAGAPGWQTNAEDTCTTIKATDFAFDYPPDASNKLAACETAITVAGIAPAYTLSLAAPGAGNQGWTNVTLNLGAAATGTQCTAVGGAGAAATTAVSPWLQFNWNGALGNPTARATFGVYRSAPIIYRRELY